MDGLEYLKEKREDVLKTIEPICETFGIQDYDYIIKDNLQKETLKLNNTYIGCSGNSIDATRDEVIAYIFYNTYCRDRGLLDIQKKIKKYWTDDETKERNGFK